MNPDLRYSGYPGAEYPKQCGAGYGYGGHGQYGTYGSCAMNDASRANWVDYDPSIVTCGGQMAQRPASPCDAPKAPKQGAACSVETFTGEDVRGCAISGGWEGPCAAVPPQHCGGSKCGDKTGCAKPKWWAEESCQMPPQHCGAAKCDGMDAQYKTVENYDGAVGSYIAQEYSKCGCGDSSLAVAQLSLPGECEASFQAMHDPGCTCTRCLAPYSMPYAAGPGCGEPHCTCPGACSGRCAGAKKGGAVAVLQRAQEAPQMLAALPKQFTGPGALGNILIASVAAYLTYKLLSRK